MEAVIVANILPTEVTTPYANFQNSRLERFNGEKVRNLYHLVTLFCSCTSTDLKFDLRTILEEHIQFTASGVLDRGKVVNASKSGMEMNGIPRQCFIEDLGL